jgi:hypothetical protein
LLVDDDDTEKRIAELERQLPDPRPAAPSTPQPPQGFPDQGDAGQQAWVPPPSVSWKQPSQKYRKLPLSLAALVIRGILSVRPCRSARQSR